MKLETTGSVDGGQVEPMRFYERRSGWQLIDLAELWRFRELVWMLALRDIKIRYRQTFVGFTWAVIQPLLTMGVFSILFRLLHSQPNNEATPFAVSCLCGLIPWQFFSSTISQSTQSLVNNKNLITKVYFPRVALLFATTITSLVDFAVAMLVLAVMMFIYGIAPSPAVFFLPLMVLLLVLTALSLSLWLAAINALYRDVQHAVPFCLQVGMFASPVVYEMNAVVPEGWRTIYSLNPMVGVLEGFRWAITGSGSPPLVSMLLSCAGVFLVLVAGLICFRRMELHFADRI